jgi:hypothetical protein
MSCVVHYGHSEPGWLVMAGLAVGFYVATFVFWWGVAAVASWWTRPRPHRVRLPRARAAFKAGRRR